jgi:hypothetical protein
MRSNNSVLRQVTSAAADLRREVEQRLSEGLKAYLE